MTSETPTVPALVRLAADTLETLAVAMERETGMEARGEWCVLLTAGRAELTLCNLSGPMAQAFVLSVRKAAQGCGWVLLDSVALIDVPKTIRGGDPFQTIRRAA